MIGIIGVCCLRNISAEVLFHEIQNKFVDIPEPPYTTPDITTQHLVRASNTKDYWERFQPERRADYLNTQSKDALNKKLTAKQLTYEEQLRKIIKDNQKVWGDIKTDTDKQRTNGVLENILKADDKSLTSVDLTKSKLQDSKFDKGKNGDIFQYGKEKGKIFTSDSKIKKLKFDDNININEDTNKLVMNSGQYYGGEVIDEAKQTGETNQDSSGRIEKPFDNIEGSGTNKQTIFLKDQDNLKVGAMEKGEFWIRDSKLVINGKLENSEEKEQGDMEFTGVSANGLKKGSSENINMVLYNKKEKVARIHFPADLSGLRTDFLFDPSDGSPGLNAFSEGAYSMLSSNQYVNLVQHDLVLKGNKIGVDIFKAFDKVSGDGIFLNVLDGETYIIFQGKEIYYPRTIEKNDFFINLITNKQDSDPYFTLIPEGAKGNYLVDNRKRTSVGDIAVENPKIKGTMIAEIRKEMWMR